VEARQIYTHRRMATATTTSQGPAVDSATRIMASAGTRRQSGCLTRPSGSIAARWARGSSLEAGDCLSEIGQALRMQDKLDEALARLEEALSICTEAGGSKHTSVSSVLTSMGNSYFRMGRLDERRWPSKFKRALVIHRIAYGNGHSRVAASLGNMCSVFSAKGMFVEARAKFEEAERDLDMPPKGPQRMVSTNVFSTNVCGPLGGIYPYPSQGPSRSYVGCVARSIPMWPLRCVMSQLL
jgi:hypothetical protein